MNDFIYIKAIFYDLFLLDYNICINIFKFY